MRPSGTSSNGYRRSTTPPGKSYLVTEFDGPPGATSERVTEIAWPSFRTAL
ncbi:hypothetical protein ACEXOS_020440 [Herbiconiux sp. P16]|uniref:hypothetical protein n=1 Tax=Herbiconiux wuyangfengii TaxID=3342794 RepID=UPI0035B7BCB5